MKILYIDDHAESRLLIHHILEAAGYDVIEAEDGLAGIRAAFGRTRRSSGRKTRGGIALFCFENLCKIVWPGRGAPVRLTQFD